MFNEQIIIEINFHSNGYPHLKEYYYTKSYYDGNINAMSPMDHPHNLNGPAVIEYYDNGDLWAEWYYVEGFLHKENGPAVITYSEQKEIIESVYFLNGQEININSQEEFENYKKHLCLV